MQNFRRFYLNNIDEDNIKIPKPLEHRIFNVLRFKEGDYFELCDGLGNVFTVLIDKNKFKITEKKFYKEAKINIDIAVSLFKPDRYKIMVEKASELGVNKLLPFISEYTKVYINNKNFLEKLSIVSSEALSQCKTAYILNIDKVKKIQELDLGTYDKVMIFHPGGEKINTIELNNIKNILLVFGPEGGFSETDLKTLNYNTYNLTNNLLRTETAVIYAVSVVDNLLRC